MPPLLSSPSQTFVVCGNIYFSNGTDLIWIIPTALQIQMFYLNINGTIHIAFVFSTEPGL